MALRNSRNAKNVQTLMAEPTVRSSKLARHTSALTTSSRVGMIRARTGLGTAGAGRVVTTG
jgi:hypothetical protein